MASLLELLSLKVAETPPLFFARHPIEGSYARVVVIRKEKEKSREKDQEE